MKGQTMKRSHKPDGKRLPEDFREIVRRLHRKEPELVHMAEHGADRKAAGQIGAARHARAEAAREDRNPEPVCADCGNDLPPDGYCPCQAEKEGQA